MQRSVSAIEASIGKQVQVVVRQSCDGVALGRNILVRNQGGKLGRKSVAAEQSIVSLSANRAYRTAPQCARLGAN